MRSETEVSYSHDLSWRWDKKPLHINLSVVVKVKSIFFPGQTCSYTEKQNNNTKSGSNLIYLLNEPTKHHNELVTCSVTGKHT